MIASIEITLGLDVCASLKEKRGMLKPLLAGIHNRYNASAAEIDMQDSLGYAKIGISLVGNDARHLQSEADTIINWVEQAWRHGDVIENDLELL